MTVIEHEMRSIDLSQYAAFLIPTETKKVRRFINWLNIGIKISMARETKSQTTFGQAVGIE